MGKVGTLDFGLDISLLNNRLNGTFDWYQRDTKGMLAPGMQLPGVVGASAPYQNTADMRTTGWELNLNWRDQIGKVSYRVGFNLSDSKSKIMKYNSNESKILTSTLSNGNTFGIIMKERKLEKSGVMKLMDFIQLMILKAPRLGY